MFQIVIEIEHIGDTESEDSQKNFEIKIHLIGGDSSCEHEIILGNLFAGAMDQSQKEIIGRATEIFDVNKAQAKDKKKHKGNGHEKGEILH